MIVIVNDDNMTTKRIAVATNLHRGMNGGGLHGCRSEEIFRGKGI